MRIGPSGNSERFYAEGFNATEQMPRWISEMGLNAYEYSFGRGVNMSHKKAEEIRTEAEKYGILVSGHAPYFVNLANLDDGMLEKSYTYITSTAEMTKAMGGERIVFHPAAQGKLSRGDAVERTVEKSKVLIERIAERGFSDMIFCPETMGKIGQIGDTTEVLKICKLWDNFIPCVDFGHLNSRTHGGLKSEQDFENILDEILQAIGERGKKMHIHFSKIMYGKGGEVKHLTFADTEYGPEFEPLGEALYKLNFDPTIICESAGTQTDDAVTMFKIMNEKFKV
ncbi:MAG: TIM barrel protein [Clostridia bacterium]